MTLIEMAITASIIPLIFLVLVSLLLDSQGFFVGEMKRFAIDGRGRAVLTRIHQEMTRAYEPTLQPFAMSDSSFVTFQAPTGYDSAGMPILGDLHTFRFVLDPSELADGIDNNGDGRIDEGSIEEVIGVQPPVVMAGDVVGFRVNRAGLAVELEVDIAMIGDDGLLITKTFLHTVTPRNR